MLYLVSCLNKFHNYSLISSIFLKNSKSKGGLRQYHFDENVTIKLKAWSFALHSHKENSMIRSKAFEAIEHHERVVTVGKLIDSFVLEEEFVDLKLEICKSLYEKLKANLRI